MTTKMNQAARAELANAARCRYQASRGKDKRRILEEFIAATGYHVKSAIRVLNSSPVSTVHRTRNRPSIYDEETRAALVVLWEASDRLCGKRLRALLPLLLPALERNGHLRLDETIRKQLQAMSAATMDRMLREARNATRPTKRRRSEPSPRRRIALRTFADWNEPPPGCMEMDLVAHCGDVNRGSFIHSLVLTDAASGWTEAAPLVVRESGLVVETLDRIREGLPFALRAVDVGNGAEFVNERLIQHCLKHGIELTRSRPYRKNDQAWIEQKNGAVVRKLLGYRRFQGLAAARAMTRLHGSARLFVNFFQPSFKLAEKHREGARVSKRYHPPQTPCERLLQSPNVPEAAKEKLREVAGSLDPLQLLEEIRAVQAQLVVLADGEKALPEAEAGPDLQAFLASLTSAWRSGEVRPTYAADAKPRYLRSLQVVTRSHPIEKPKLPPPATSPAPARPSVTYAKPGSAKVNALTMVWPLVCRRLEGAPDINCQQLFEELCLQFPGRFTRWQYKRLVRHVKVWRQDARARGVVIGCRRWRKLSSRPRSRRRRLFDEHWTEMTQHLEFQPDQTALELLIEFQARYPGRYSLRSLDTLQRRVRAWRREEVERLVCELKLHTTDTAIPVARK